jgi:hypothetical protein
MGFFCMVLCSMMAQAKVRSINSSRDFERNIAQVRMAVVLFYEDTKDNSLKDRNKRLFAMYQDISKAHHYNDADMTFLTVNMNRKDLKELADLYKVADAPTILFFNNGQCLRTRGENPIAIRGFVTRGDLESAINTHYGSEIKTYVAKKELRKNELIREENESWKPYFYPRDMVVRGYAPEERQETME